MHGLVTARSETPAQLLAGRPGAVEVVEKAVDALVRGQGDCVVLEAGKGFGKSRLLGHAVDLAAARGVVTGHGAATPLDHLAPLSTLWTTLQTCCGTRLTLDRPGEALTSTLLIDRLGAHLEELAKHGPLLVGIDDIDRADELTALALRVLVPSLAHLPLLWVVTRSPSGQRSPIGDALEPLFDGHAQRVELPALSRTGAAELCEQLLGACPDPQLLGLLARAQGHPYLVAELVRTLDREGRILRGGGQAALLIDPSVAAPGQALPTGFVDAFSYQTRTLSESARSVLAAAAVLSRPFSLHEAAGVTGQAVSDLYGGAGEAVHAEYLQEREDGLSFRLDLSQEAVYRSLSTTLRQAMHREAATMVEAQGRSAGEVADHLVLRGDRSRAGSVLKALPEDGSGVDAPRSGERNTNRASKADRHDGHEACHAQREAPTRPGDGTDEPDVAWAELTPAEMRVTRQVAEGMTNRQVASSLVVSPHTVDSHLRHSFAKLNVTSRVELTRLFFTLGEGADRAKS